MFSLSAEIKESWSIFDQRKVFGRLFVRLTSLIKTNNRCFALTSSAKPTITGPTCTLLHSTAFFAITLSLTSSWLQFVDDIIF